MAKKDRVPTPPKRPVQAPKAYKPEGNPRRTRLIFIGLAALIVLVIAAVGVGFMVSGGGDGSDDAAASADGCTRQTFDALEAGHVDELPGDYEYNSLPATSGLHNPQPALWNLYDQPVPQINYVHNMEHGGVVIQYGSEVPAADVAALRDWYSQDTRGLLIAPLDPEMEDEDATLAGTVVATAWTHMLRCDGFNEAALDDFSDDFRGPQGDNPEKFDLDALQQGS